MILDTALLMFFEGVLLRCLGEEEANQAMEEAHSGVCGVHQSGPKLHFHLKRMGYYWPSMVNECPKYAKRCQAYQFHANFIHQLLKPLHPTLLHDYLMQGDWMSWDQSHQSHL